MLRVHWRVAVFPHSHPVVLHKRSGDPHATPFVLRKLVQRASSQESGSEFVTPIEFVRAVAIHRHRHAPPFETGCEFHLALSAKFFRHVVQLVTVLLGQVALQLHIPVVIGTTWCVKVAE